MATDTVGGGHSCAFFERVECGATACGVITTRGENLARLRALDRPRHAGPLLEFANRRDCGGASQ